MQLVRFEYHGQEGFGILKDQEILGELVDVLGWQEGIRGLLARGGSALKEASGVLEKGRTFDHSEIRFLPPVSEPRKIICVGLNYFDHSTESGFEQPEYPTLFTRFASTLIGHENPVIREQCSDQYDYEGEIVAVIGAGGRNIAKERALEHVAGYSLFNDVSVRDYQFKTPQWTLGKNFDTTGPFGPAFVSADELPPGAAGLRLKTRVNGTEVQNASTDDMVFKIDELVSMISGIMTLEPGDLIVSGTPAGVGFARKPPVFLANGDVCEIDVDGLGVLRNTIADA